MCTSVVTILEFLSESGEILLLLKFTSSKDYWISFVGLFETEPLKIGHFQSQFSMPNIHEILPNKIFSSEYKIR